MEQRETKRITAPSASALSHYALRAVGHWQREGCCESGKSKEKIERLPDLVCCGLVGRILGLQGGIGYHDGSVLTRSVDGGKQ